MKEKLLEREVECVSFSVLFFFLSVSFSATKLSHIEPNEFLCVQIELH